MTKIRQITFVLLAIGVLAACEDSDRGDSSAQESTKNAIAQSESVANATTTSWPRSNTDDAIDLADKRTRDNIMLVLDMSGSMSESECAGDATRKADAAKTALREWLSEVPPKANVGLTVFNASKVRTVVPLGVNNRDDLQQAFHAQTREPAGSTPLRDAVAHAHAELEAQGRRQEGYGSYRIVVITDGRHSSGQNPRPEVESIYSNPANPVQISTVGFCIGADHALNINGVTTYTSAQTPKQLATGLDNVLPESRDFDAADFEKLDSTND